jgi:hypothetical protein
MKLCNEANPIMDDNSKLQYLKNGLKSLQRLDILLKDPKNPEEFLEYVQKIEEVKSLDEKQVAIDDPVGKSFAIPSKANQINRNIKPQQTNQSSSPQQTYIIKRL